MKDKEEKYNAGYEVYLNNVPCDVGKLFQQHYVIDSSNEYI